ncbi:MAG: DNA-processing protein DprA [Firmicutes bacterium]|nr:DNA-processing protein DprA [Bacillota bacterium]
MTLTKETLYFFLATSGITAKKQNELLDNFSVEEIYDRVGSDRFLFDFLGETAFHKLQSNKNIGIIEKKLDRVYESGIKFVTRDSKDYPENLKHSEINPPTILYYKGDISLLKKTIVAIVGTRFCSEYGKLVTKKIARELSNYSICVASGLAYGVDAFAHEAVMKAGGKTIAVLASGLNRPSPAGNIKLFHEIEQSGLSLSEYFVDDEAQKHTFPERNRIVAGISTACIVTEAPQKSGALITANIATEIGREVFSVPGSILSGKSEGTNALIKNGANALTDIMDIIHYLKTSGSKIKQTNVAVSLDFLEQRVYTLLKDEPQSIEELVDNSKIDLSDLFSIMLSMEVKGVVARGVGNKYTVI